MSTSLGKQGERYAAAFLQTKGYEVVETNYRYKRNEIDLIVKKGTLLVFVEVKAKSSSAYGYPEASVDNNKAARVIEAAEHYILTNNWTGIIRFDIVAILTLGQKIEVKHFEDAFH